jgi:wobble nucleotide-excising tRNase
MQAFSNRVLDDPVSSFDYNYVGNFCNRLRDWYRAHSDKQLIILAHSWEFFVQVQTVLRKAYLESALSVMVMENCSIVSDYTEERFLNLRL